MTDRIWISITDTSAEVGLVLSITGNTVLLSLLIWGRALEGIGSYRYLMVTFCVFSLMYTFLESFLRPLMHHYDNTIWVMQRKRYNFSASTARILSSIYCGCFAMCFVLFAIHFVYRYYVSCRPEMLLCFRRRNYVYWILAVLGVAMSWMAVAYFLFPEDAETRDGLNYVLSTYGLTTDEIGYVPYAFFYTEGTERKWRRTNLIGVVHHLTVMQCAITAVFYYGIRTYWNIVRIKVKSQRTKDLQHQFFMALVVQTAIPLFFMFIPNSVLTIAAIVDGNFGAWANVTVVMTHLYPGVDPFVILYLIKSLRDTVKSFFCLRIGHRAASIASIERPTVRREGRSMSSVVI